MGLPVTAVTVAFGCPEVVRNWVEAWSSTGVSCLITDNGNQLPPNYAGKAEVLPFSGNSGFGAGINRAVRECSTPVVLITNPDTLPESSESPGLLLEFHSRGAFTGGSTHDSSGKAIHSTGIWPERKWVRSQIFHPARSLWRPDRADWLQGSLIMAHRDDFLEIGGFGSRFPLYFEDVDLCARAKKRGMKIDYCDKCGFVHDQGSGSNKVTATRLSCFHWGMLEYFRVHDPENANAVRRMIIAKCMLRVAFYSIRDREASKGYFRALRSIVTGIAPGLPGAVNG